MARISGSIPNLINGVSQQAMALRMASQADIQINAYSTAVDGLIKRPPTIKQAKLTGTFQDQPIHCHNINRDTIERYETVWSRNGIRVFDIAGNERQVNYTGGTQYLQYTEDATGKPPFRTTTIGDFTYLTNTQRVVGMDPNIVEPAQNFEAMVYVMAGNYGKTYTISIDGTLVASYSTPDGSSGAQSPGVDTSYIARRLATGETQNLGQTVNNTVAWVYKATDKNLTTQLAGLGFTVLAGKGVIYITCNRQFAVTVEDGFNGHAMKAIQYQTQDFSDLPAYGPDGVAIKVQGSVTTQFDDYYVRFKGIAGQIAGGLWVECPAPGSRKAFNAESMPHAMVRQADGTFNFGPVDWEDRRCGDEITSPQPSFIDSPINDIFWFKNRLGFLSGENVILGRAGGPFDFWKTTATTGMDDDPIDVASSESDVSVLKSAVGFADRLILFADQSQAMLQGGDTLTFKTVSIKPSTQYSMSSFCRPTVNGDNIYFPVKRGQYSMVREYTIDPASDLGVAEDITGNVPTYIDGNIVRMDSSTHDDVVVVQTDAAHAVPQLFVYKYFYQTRQKVQSSWSVFQFPGVKFIWDFWFIESRMYVLCQFTNGETWITYMDVQPGGVDDGMDFIVNLDLRGLQPASGTYDPLTDRTHISGIDVLSLTNVLVTAAGGPLSPGLSLEPLNATTSGFDLVGDLTGQPFYYGVNYVTRYKLSTIYLRIPSSVSQIPIATTEGRLQLIKLLMNYSSTSFLRCIVTPRGQTARTYETNGRVMGDPNNKADTVVISDGTLEVPILSQNDKVTIEFVNDSYLPCSMLSVEWIANYVQKSRRV